MAAGAAAAAAAGGVRFPGATSLNSPPRRLCGLVVASAGCAARATSPAGKFQKTGAVGNVPVGALTWVWVWLGRAGLTMWARKERIAALVASAGTLSQRRAQGHFWAAMVGLGLTVLGCQRAGIP